MARERRFSLVEMMVFGVYEVVVMWMITVHDQAMSGWVAAPNGEARKERAYPRG